MDSSTLGLPQLKSSLFGSLQLSGSENVVDEHKQVDLCPWPSPCSEVALGSLLP